MKKSDVLQTRLAALREARHLSQLELAVRAGVTESTIKRAERSLDGAPALQMRSLRKIADALDVPVAELLQVAEPRRGYRRIGRRPKAPEPPDAVLFVQDLALELRISARKIRTLLKDAPWTLPETLPAFDNRPRWARVVVERWLEKDNRQRELTTRALVRARR